MREYRIQLTAHAKTKLQMWYKVQELKRHHLKNVQIAAELGINRDTVSSYLRMSETEFLQSGSFQRNYSLKLSDYEEEVYRLLSDKPYLTSAQISDTLRDRHGPLDICEKTFYNFVEYVRLKYTIPKTCAHDPRIYTKVEECQPGEYAQVDFGERYIDRAGGGKKKVYFFAMVLCHSRYKFIFFSETPFTSELAVYAHELAFEYFGGIPHYIIYDQDKVFIHRENFGDYLLTSVFQRFVEEHHFERIFCRKSDPESKGKVENVVKYVKRNFLTGRDYTNITDLNTAVLGWLERTANGMRHGGTCKIPAEVFAEHERQALRPYHGIPTAPKQEIKAYIVHKDNTIQYRRSYYSLPAGTYRGANTEVYIEDDGENLNIFDKETGKTLCSHTKAAEAGSHIFNPAHRRPASERKEAMKTDILNKVGNDTDVCEYLAEMETDRPRYVLTCLSYVTRNMHKYDAAALVSAVKECRAGGIYNAGTLLDVAGTMQKRLARKAEASLPSALDMSASYSDMTPERTDIKSFNSLL